MSLSLCMGLPSASKTACEVKFSEGIRLMKCFCRLFSYEESILTWRILGIACPIAYLLDNVVNGRIGLFEVCREQLGPVRIQMLPQYVVLELPCAVPL